MNYIENLYKYLPTNNIINWDLITTEILNKYYKDMINTNQEPKWHGEGNVFIHTKMVCEKLINLEEYQNLKKINKLQVFLATLFHDIGKIVCTKVVDDEITSPNHAITGSLIIREFLWKELNLSGTKEYQNFRETICLLIKYHTNPIYIGKDYNEKRVIKLSLNQELVTDFSLELLSILSKADVLGRISNDTVEQLLYLEQFITLSKDLNCFKNAYKFTNNYTKYKYFRGNNIHYTEELYDNTKKEVIMICGLPGTGKDTYINSHFSLPIVSLDQIREVNNLKDNDDQGVVFNIAKEEMKKYLRLNQSFIFNATNTHQINRQKLINLFADYNAKVHIIFLETSWKENILRNNNREKSVNVKIIEKMLSSLDIPENYESHIVKWICI